MLQKPLFGVDFPMFINYGALGPIAGHEITHGFDNNGHYYGKQGELTNLWTIESENEFNQRSSCISQQYDAITIPNIEFTVDGSSTLAENIADNGGLRTAFHTYEKFINKNGPEKLLPGLQKFTNKQLFFVSFAQFHCEKETLDYTENQLMLDGHAHHYARVFGTLSNTKEFAETFNCPVDSVYNPSHKCSVY